MRRWVWSLTVLAALVWASSAAAGGWSSSVAFTNQVASKPVQAGGYFVRPGATAPAPGDCRLGDYNANRSESWIAVKPGTEDLVGTSKFFFEKYSTFYDFHLGSYSMPGGTPGPNAFVTGYDCVSTGTQDMPPSWTNNTDPNVDFDTQGRAYQVTLPFNAYWVNLRPNSNIGIVYSDDLGRTWALGNGGEPLEHAPNWSSLSFGFVEDKQWVAVDHNPLSPFRDYVYAAWAVYNGQTTKINLAVSADRGQTFSKRVTVTDPSQTGSTNEYVYPAVDAAGSVYLVVASSSPSDASAKTIYVSRSTDGGSTWGPWFRVASVRALVESCCLPNTTFRDGIIEHMVASPTYPGHLYIAYEEWDGSHFDIRFVQSTDGGVTWTAPATVNDASTVGDGTDQFQPEVAAGPAGGVAVAFYDRRQPCPGDASIRPQDVGRTNFCIDTSLQAYRDTGAGAVAVGSNVRISQYTWDPEQPDQTIDGIDQMACAGHRNPCTSRAFIGDYFGLAMSAANVYGFWVSTHYPSKVRGDGGARVYYQQQVLGTVARSALGI